MELMKQMERMKLIIMKILSVSAGGTRCARASKNLTMAHLQKKSLHRLFKYDREKIISYDRL